MAAVRVYVRSFTGRGERYYMNAYEYLLLDPERRTGYITTHFTTARRKVLQFGKWTDEIKFSPIEVAELMDHAKN